MFYLFSPPGYEWVGWKNVSQNPVEIVFHFDEIRNFSAVHIHANNLFTKDVQVTCNDKKYRDLTLDSILLK